MHCTAAVSTRALLRDKITLVYARNERDPFVLSTSTLSNSRQTSIHCPKDLTHAESEEQCISLQEHVWGTDGLARLEAIKAKVDPQGLFQCQKCVGFKGPVRDQ